MNLLKNFRAASAAVAVLQATSFSRIRTRLVWPLFRHRPRFPSINMAARYGPVIIARRNQSIAPDPLEGFRQIQARSATSSCVFKVKSIE